ncbi:MAG TPA: hypothetical protein VKU80_01240 [Planctomycetota bacterium]|nr:hypothetical protein [Planctomycetota bacterium]
MDARKKEIERLDADLRRLEHQITADCFDIGRRAAAAAPSAVNTEELAKYLNSAVTLQNSISGFHGDIERIRGLVLSLAALQKEVDDAVLRRDQILRERQSRFMELGAGAFSVFRKLPDGAAYRPLFEELLKIDKEVEERQQELQSLQEQEQSKGFFDKIKLKAKKVMVRGEISRLDRAKTSAYEHAGARIADTDFSRHADGTLRELFGSIRDRKAAADAILEDNARRQAEMEHQRLELQRLEAVDRAEERVRDLERRIESLGKELEVIHCWTGQLFLDRDIRHEIKDLALSERIDSVLNQREAIRQKRQAIDRLKAEGEMEELLRKEKERRARRKQLEEEMRIKERQISTIDIEINVGLRRIEELKRVISGEAGYVDAPPLPPLPDLYPPTEPPPPKT